MSHDPFQDLFDSEIPRPASAASTRSTLDTLAPQFHRAKARRRARVSAVAAFAVLGTTGGAAALGVGPVALNNSPRINHNNPVASSGAEVEDPPESTTTTAPTTTVTTTTVTTTTILVTTAAPTTIPDVEVATTLPADSSASDDNSDSHSSEDGSDSGKSNANDESSDGSSDSSGESSTPSPEPGHDPSTPSDPEPQPSAPVAGPLTKSVDEGSATVDIGPNGLLIVDVTPATGMGYEVKTKPDEIDIEFHDLVSGDEMSALEFKLVDGGITVTVDHPH